MKQISFLIGAGFSVPANYPTGSEVNRKFIGLSKSDIRIESCGTAFFANRNTSHDASWMNVSKRQFLEDFLRFYQETVIDDVESFHYESFFDYYIEIINGKILGGAETDFFESWKHENEVGTPPSSLVAEFHSTYSQLIARLLEKPLNLVFSRDQCEEKYYSFLSFIRHAVSQGKVLVHSLNHDLYLEHLLTPSLLNVEVCDGFNEFGSEFFGELRCPRQHYKVRLPKFCDDFSQQLCIYKLHGSIDFYWYASQSQSDLLRLKNGVSHLEMFREFNQGGILVYEQNSDNYYPEILTGTHTKIGRYSLGEYYPILFKHFEENLRTSKILVVIGYGFSDPRINEYLEEYLGSTKNTIYAIGRTKPCTPIFDHGNAHFISGGVEDFDVTVMPKLVEIYDVV